MDILPPAQMVITLAIGHWLDSKPEMVGQARKRRFGRRSQLAHSVQHDSGIDNPAFHRRLAGPLQPLQPNLAGHEQQLVKQLDKRPVSPGIRFRLASVFAWHPFSPGLPEDVIAHRPDGFWQVPFQAGRIASNGKPLRKAPGFFSRMGRQCQGSQTGLSRPKRRE